MADTKGMIAALNNALAQEHACIIRYSTHAAVVTGPSAEQIATRLKEIATDEREHADQLRQRIIGLGGTPTMTVAVRDLIPATTLPQILKVNIKEEQSAIEMYRAILKAVPHDEGTLLYETIEGILKDEQEHLEELERLCA